MPSSDTRRILIVEDAEPIRKMVCSMLHQSGYQCLEAGNGSEALRLIERESGEIHLVLTDMMMPHMNGSELVRRLSLTRPELPVILMSGYTEDPVVQGVAETGMTFLPKPFTAMALIEKVERILDSPPRQPDGPNPGHRQQ